MSPHTQKEIWPLLLDPGLLALGQQRLFKAKWKKLFFNLGLILIFICSLFAHQLTEILKRCLWKKQCKERLWSLFFVLFLSFLDFNFKHVKKKSPKNVVFWSLNSKIQDALFSGSRSQSSQQIVAHNSINPHLFIVRMK